MDKKNLMPIAAQPVNRTTTGQLPPELAELSEEALQLLLHGGDSEGSHSGVREALFQTRKPPYRPSYEGDEAE
jgi:bacteriocin leader peptide (microcyclamide/patellamide family)